MPGAPAIKLRLAWREGEYRDEILSKVSAARAEGDLSENGGYQAAREAQRVNQGRIEELTVKLRKVNEEIEDKAEDNAFAADLSKLFG